MGWYAIKLVIAQSSITTKQAPTLSFMIAQLAGTMDWGESQRNIEEGERYQLADCPSWYVSSAEMYKWLRTGSPNISLKGSE